MFSKALEWDSHVVTDEHSPVEAVEPERANHIQWCQRRILLHVLDTKVGECVLRIKTYV